MLRPVNLLMLRPPSSCNFLSCPAFVIDEDTAVFFSVLRQLLQHLMAASTAAEFRAWYTAVKLLELEHAVYSFMYNTQCL